MKLWTIGNLKLDFILMMIALEDGDAEMWCGWREQLNELYQLVQLRMADQKSKPVKSLNFCKALALCTTHRALVEHQIKEQIAHDDAVKNIFKPKELLASPFDNLAQKHFPSVKHSYRHQVFYMR
jgi:hypothetical protein